ncbi:hypothetical protein quinque_014647 [Culex quinquefasciatus]
MLWGNNKNGNVLAEDRANWIRFKQFVDDRVEENPVLDSKEAIDRALQVLEDSLNEAKDLFIPTSKVTKTRNTDRLKPTTKLKVLGTEVDWSQVVRYLELLIDFKLLFRFHLDGRIIKGIAMLKKLYPIINRRSKASLENKLAVYKMVVTPMLLYGSPIWQGCAMTHRKKL